MNRNPNFPKSLVQCSEDFVCSIVLLSTCRTKMSPRLLMCFLHTSLCYGGGYLWVRGLGAAQWVNNVKVYFTENI